jgi:hypothetical protein
LRQAFRAVALKVVNEPPKQQRVVLDGAEDAVTAVTKPATKVTAIVAMIEHGFAWLGANITAICTRSSSDSSQFLFATSLESRHPGLIAIRIIPARATSCFRIASPDFLKVSLAMPE